MNTFNVHTIDSAPEAAKPGLEAATKAFGSVPNLHGVLAEAPAALSAYGALWDAFGQSSFSDIEKQVVYLTSNYENECHYCMAGHSMLAKMSGMDDDSVEALREGTPLGEEKLEALRAFTRAVVVNRGWVSDEITQSFLNAGYTQQNILEVILGVSVKVLSNYTNHFANTPLDPFMKGTEWTHPNKRDAS